MMEYSGLYFEFGLFISSIFHNPKETWTRAKQLTANYPDRGKIKNISLRWSIKKINIRRKKLLFFFFFFNFVGILPPNLQFEGE